LKILLLSFVLQEQYFVLRLINFSVYLYTLEQILAYPIELLIPWYHQNLRGIVKLILFKEYFPFNYISQGRCKCQGLLCIVIVQQF